MLICTFDQTSGATAPEGSARLAESPDRTCHWPPGDGRPAALSLREALLDVLEELREDAPERLPRWLVWVLPLAAVVGLAW